MNPFSVWELPISFIKGQQGANISCYSDFTDSEYIDNIYVYIYRSISESTEVNQKETVTSKCQELSC